MPKVIDHKKRKDLIVRTALRIYDEGGLKEANLSHIAQECGLSRTTVYQYFSDVSDLFNYMVKSRTDWILVKYEDASYQEGNCAQRLERIVRNLLDTTDEYRDEIVRFVKSLSAINVDIEHIVHHRSAKLRLFLGRLIRSGIREGSIRKCRSSEAVEKITALILSYGFMLSYFPESASYSRSLVLDYTSFLSSSGS